MAQGSIRSLAGLWLGGISAPVTPHQGSVRSLMAFWMGGASAQPIIPPPIPSGGGATLTTAGYRHRLHDDLHYRKRKPNDDAEVLELLSIIE